MKLFKLAVSAIIASMCVFALALTPVEIEFTNPQKGYQKAVDSDVTTAFKTSECVLNFKLEIGTLQVEWLEMPKSWQLFTSEDGKTWEKFGNFGDNFMLRENIQFETPVKFAKIITNGNQISEIVAYPVGELGEDIQLWKPTPKKADLLVISAHPDDDILFMGGTIPYYAGQMQKETVVAYMSHQKRVRQSEAMDGLWVCKNTTTPVFVGFPDRYSESLKEGLEKWGGEDKITKSLVELLRKYKPEVVVTHDVNGEYGHGAHRSVAKCIQTAVKVANDPEKYPESAKKYGTWQVKKLYLHLFKENKISMDWREPLSAFGGKTAFDTAVKAYDQHKSQHIYYFSVQDTGRTSCAEFGLAFSTVGLDTGKNDFFENIIEPLPAATPVPTIAPTIAPAQPQEDSMIAATTKNNTNNHSEIIVMTGQTSNQEGAKNNVLKITIACILLAIGIICAILIIVFKKKKAKSSAMIFALLILVLTGTGCGARASSLKPIHTPTASNDHVLVVLPDASSSSAQTAQPTPSPEPEPTPTPTPEPTIDPEDKYYEKPGQEYFETNEQRDYWIYKSDSLFIEIKKIRDDANNQTYFVAEIKTRNGERERSGYANMTYGGKREFPYKTARRYDGVFAINGDFVITEDKELKGIIIRDGEIFNDGNRADTMAFMPDGEIKIIHPGDTTAQELLDLGVNNAYSFGPTLVENGVVNPETEKHRLRSANPRCGIGMIAPNHYIAIVTEGRKKDARGFRLVDLAQLFVDFGCQNAYNLDGGASASMIMMGESLVLHETDEAGQRPVPDVLMFGKSELVPDLKDKVINDGNNNIKMWPLPAPKA